ncbi:MAG: succinate dehydrogenase assembly factor 2 [Pseudomonadota bacterium]|nr:succinate dehydrogenase assembly factor 2 [Pseudomonadota bacterium]
MSITPEQLSKLRWRCRRGTQELDLLLMRFIVHRAATAETAEMLAFERLLACEDRDLQRWFLAYAACPDPDLSALVDAIRSLPAA